MKIIKDVIILSELKEMSAASFGDMVKAVVDISRELIAVDADLHSDLESLLLENGSKQKDLWGINLYPDAQGDELIEFDSMINMRPTQGNKSRGIDNKEISKKVIEIVLKRIKQ